MIGIPIEDVRTILQEHVILRYGTQRAAAKAWGLSPSHVSEMLHGTRTIADRVLSEIGIERLTIYRAISESRRNK